MKKMTKLLASILIIAMAASILCVPAFADGEETNVLAKYAEGTGYVALGDSYSRGFGASDNWENEVYLMDNHGSLEGQKTWEEVDNDGKLIFEVSSASYNCRNVTGSFPLLVANGLNLNTPSDIRDTGAKYWPIAQNGLTTAFFLDLLGIDDNFFDDEYIHSSAALRYRYDADLAYFGDVNSCNVAGDGTYGKEGEVDSICDLLNEASLVTIQLGQGDVLHRNITLYIDDIDLSDTETLPAAIENLISQLYSSFEYWKGAYKLLLDYIKENNDDATVVLVGAVNPIQNVVLDNDYLVPIGSAINVLFDLMNQYYKQCADDYGYIYVDISNIETPSTENTQTLTEALSEPLGLNLHPTPNGYAQIARLILAALEQKEAAEQEAKTTIRVDLGRLADVDYVMLDGKKITNYTVENSVLTIKAGTPFAKSLTVATHDGLKVAISVYSLSYDNGYSAYRLYTTNDVLKAAATTAKSAATAIKGALGKLFSK